MKLFKFPTNRLRDLSLVGLAFCALSSADAVMIDIDGAANEFADYSGLSASINSPDPWGTSAVTEIGVTLSVLNNSVHPGNASQVGLSWNNNWQSGSYVVGAEINTMQSQSASNGAPSPSANATAAIADQRYMTISLESASDPINWDSIDVTLWRNGDGAPAFYQFAYDDEGTGYDSGDLLGSATAVGTLIGNEDTISFSAAGLPSNFTSDEVRLYFWGGTSNTGNFHITKVEAEYSAVPEPGSLALLGLAGLTLLRRRRR